jgi:hypothetical protein
VRTNANQLNYGKIGKWFDMTDLFSRVETYLTSSLIGRAPEATSSRNQFRKMNLFSSILLLAGTCCMLASAQDLELFSRVLKDRACAGGKPDAVIFGTPEDAVVEYFEGFHCPKPEPADKDYYCRTRTSDNAISFEGSVMEVNTNKWVAGGFRMGCMKKDFTTGWQCAAACGTGPNLPKLSEVSV